MENDEGGNTIFNKLYNNVIRGVAVARAPRRPITTQLKLSTQKEKQKNAPAKVYREKIQFINLVKNNILPGGGGHISVRLVYTTFICRTNEK